LAFERPIDRQISSHSDGPGGFSHVDTNAATPQARRVRRSIRPMTAAAISAARTTRPRATAVWRFVQVEHDEDEQRIGGLSSAVEMSAGRQDGERGRAWRENVRDRGRAPTRARGAQHNPTGQEAGGDP
jgi:hypothetical protein